MMNKETAKKILEDATQRIDNGEYVVLDHLIELLEDVESSDDAAIGSLVKKLVKRHLRHIVREIVVELLDEE